MAKKLEDYKIPHRTTGSPTGRPGKYPWDLWFNGEIWMLKHGEDFQCKPYSMEITIRKAASARELQVSVVHHDPETLVIMPRDIHTNYRTPVSKP